MIKILKDTLYKIVSIYWKIFKPKTYGVKVLIVHPTDTNKILLILHSYGNKILWNIPGGGYRPKKETAQQAAIREVQEELNINLQSVAKVGKYYTEIQGKRDTVILFTGKLHPSFLIEQNDEIAKLKWIDHQEALEQDNVAKIAKTTIRYQFDLVK